MSLKKKRKRPSFVLRPSDKPGYVVMYERDEKSGKFRVDEGMEFRLKDLKEKPIDTLTHEFSERELKRQLEKENIFPFHEITRFTPDGYGVNLPAIHIPVSYHTESGMETDGKYKEYKPKEFEEFMNKSLGISDLYPNQYKVKKKWDKLMEKGRNAKTNKEAKEMFLKAKKFLKDNEYEVDEKTLKHMKKVIDNLGVYYGR